jgi:hypothetical protein
MARSSPPRASNARPSFQSTPPSFASIAVLAIAILASGCASSRLGKQPASFATAASLVVQNTTDAYTSAIDLHAQEQAYAGALKVEAGDSWDYASLVPLLTPEELKARTQVLDALKTYAQSLSAITGSTPSPTLVAAAKSTGASLKTISSAIQSEQGDKNATGVSATTANIVSTATLALGEYLAANKVNADLPAITAQMDPQIQTLCTLLTNDIDTIRKQTKKDSEDLRRQQWTFITVNRAKLSPIELRAEVEKLPAILKNEQTSDAALANLLTAIQRLATAHHALAVASQANNPETTKQRLADFDAAGTSLGSFYQGLPSK